MGNEESVKGAVSYGTAATAVICSAVLGIIGTWAVLDGPAQELLVDNGSLADWAAAAATLGVGIAAWRISVTNHRHQIRESNESRSRSLRTSRSRLAHAKLQGIDLLTIVKRAEEFTELKAKTVSKLRFFIERTEASTDTLNYSEDTLCEFPSEAITKLARLNNAIGVLRLLIASGNDFVRIYGSENDEEEIDDVDERLVVQILEECTTVEQRYTEFMTCLGDELDRVVALQGVVHPAAPSPPR